MKTLKEKIVPIYEFEHPETGEIFEEMRKMKDADKPFVAPDGTVCKRIVSNFMGKKAKNEVFEEDGAYVKSCRPKYVKFRDGHRERYDPTRHIGAPGKVDNSLKFPKGKPGKKVFVGGSWWEWDDVERTWSQVD
jgi:predicted nucleic acid-binding Zn ribbon protein